MHEIDDAPQQRRVTGARHSALLSLHPQSATTKRGNLDKGIVVAKGVVRIKMKGRLDVTSEHKCSEWEPRMKLLEDLSKEGRGHRKLMNMLTRAVDAPMNIGPRAPTELVIRVASTSWKFTFKKIA